VKSSWSRAKIRPATRASSLYCRFVDRKADGDGTAPLCAGQLPEAMMPSAFVFLKALPLTPNGKVNRKALNAPENERPELEAAYVAPRDNLEKSIAKIWQELLHVEKVGLRDNFFDLGGNSLLVVQTQARLRGSFGIELPVVKLFQHPTIHSLASFLNERPKPASDKVQSRGQRKQAAFARRQKRGRRGDGMNAQQKTTAASP